jgi:hypothetical protein
VTDDDRIPMTCCDCGAPFLALGEWQARCRRCYWIFKSEQAECAADRGNRIAALEREIATLRAQLAAAQADRDRWRLLAQAKPKRAPRAVKLRIPPDVWRRLLQTAHPDKHNGSAVAVEATRWLLENRPS